MHHRFILRSFCVVAAVLAASTLDNTASTSLAEASSFSANANDEQNTATQRQREGTQVADQEGYFRTSGDGLIFHLRNSEEKYPALENLALERIGKVMGDRHDHPDQLHWKVSGFFTEYRGSNYLFITHAVLENKRRGVAGMR